MKKQTSGIINKKVLIGTILVAGAVLFYLFLLLNGLAYRTESAETPKANITVLAANIVPTIDTNLLFVTPTPTIDAAISEKGIFINSFVKVIGTEGSGLRIRSAAGTSSETVFLANEAEVFRVIGGPEVIDNIVWWKLATPYDDNRQGWASGDYLKVIIEQ